MSLCKGENIALIHAMPGQSKIEVKVRSDGPQDRVRCKLFNKNITQYGVCIHDMPKEVLIKV